MTKKTTNIVLIGTGGQGALTIMEMLALAAEMAEQEVRVLSRVSLARLGGAGVCHIRLGPSSSPAIPMGEADLLLTLEMSEVLRALPLARRGARAFVSTYRRLPIAAGIEGRRYPTQTEIVQALGQQEVSAVFVPANITHARSSAQRPPLGVAPTLASGTCPPSSYASRVNMIMLGVLCGAMELLPRSILEKAIALRLPHLAEQNLHTFAAGWQFAKNNCVQGLTIL